MSALTLFPLQYKRQGDVPVDIDMTFATTAERMVYLSNARRYAGMLVVDNEEEKCYLLNSARDAWIAVGSAQLTVQDEGVALGSTPTTVINIVGDSVAATSADDGATVNVTVEPSLHVQDEGTPVGAMTTKTLNFVGAGVTTTSGDNGETVVVTIPSGGGGGTDVHVQDEGSSLGANALTTLNFVGAGVTASSSNSGTTVTVTVPGGSLPTVYEYNQAAVTMDPSHLGNIVRMGYATTQTYTVTETVGSECPIGTSLVITWSGIGLVTIVQGANAIIYTPETLNIRKRYGQVTLTKMQAPNVWQVEGNLQSS